MTTPAEPIEPKPAARVLEVLLGETWAISAAGHAKLVEIASRENLITAEVLDKINQRQEAVAAKRAARMDNTEGVVKRDGVAIIEVAGPIFRYADLFSQISGATSIETLATDFTAAINDPSVNGVILTFDSPGGMVSGVNELANMIRDRVRRIPVVAYVGTLAASAAYWLASAADRIVIDATAQVGSIGAVVGARIPNQSNIVERVSEQSPRKRLSPTTEAGQAEMQKTANTIAQVFIDFVKANRPDDVDTLGGSMAMGEAAVDAKLVDGIGSLEGLIAELSQADLGRPRLAAASINHRKGVRTMTKQAAAQAAEPEMSEAATPEMITALNEKLNGVTAELETARAERAAAELDKLKTEANAKVDGWERDGVISGNATKAVRDVYVALATKQTVTVAQFDAMIAALPKFETTRLSKDAKPPADLTGDVTLADVRAASQDPAAAQKVQKVIKQRREKDPKFDIHALARELSAKSATA